MADHSEIARARFGNFELDLRSGELRRGGMLLRLQEKPFRVLAALVEARGELVSREALFERLWPPDTHVEFEAGLNAAINRLRDVLGDSADSPRFIGTVPRKGYRLLSPVESIDAPSTLEANVDRAHTNPAPDGGTTETADHAAGRRRLHVGFVIIAIVVAVGLWTRFGTWNDEETPPPGTRTRLVVLPFDDLNDGSERDFFSEGLTEEMITRLGGMRPDRLGVIARTSAMRYRATDKSIVEIGDELEVDYVLEGSVRRTLDRVRVSAKLIQVADQTPLWTGAFDRQLSDILVVQEDLAREIARALELKLLDVPGSGTATKADVDPEAYEATLLGRHHLAQRTHEGCRRALDAFDRAIESDPDWAPAWVGRAEAYILLGNYDFMRPREAFPLAQAAVTRALDLEPELATAHAAQGMIHLAFDWEWNAAERELNRAIELNRGYAPAHHYLAIYLTAIGRPDEAIARLEQARRLDPFSRIINAEIGWRLFFARRYDEAIDQLSTTIELDPGFAVARDNLTWVYFVTGDYEAFLDQLLEVKKLEGDAPEELIATRATVERVGWLEARRSGIPEMIGRADESYRSAYDIALEYAAVEEGAAAIEWLSRACEEREIDLIMVAVDPRMDPVRPLDGFSRIERCVGLPGSTD